MNKKLLLAVALSCSFSALSASSVYITQDNTSLRSGNTPDARVLKSLTKGEALQQLTLHYSGWSQVEMNGLTGWVLSNKLSNTPPKTLPKISAKNQDNKSVDFLRDSISHNKKTADSLKDSINHNKKTTDSLQDSISRNNKLTQSLKSAIDKLTLKNELLSAEIRTIKENHTNLVANNTLSLKALSQKNIKIIDENLKALNQQNTELFNQNLNASNQKNQELLNQHLNTSNQKSRELLDQNLKALNKENKELLNKNLSALNQKNKELLEQNTNLSVALANPPAGTFINTLWVLFFGLVAGFLIRIALVRNAKKKRNIINRSY